MNRMPKLLDGFCKSLSIKIFNFFELLHHRCIAHEADIIKNTSLFDSLSEIQLSKILKSVRLIKYPSNALIFRENDEADALFIIVNGSVRVFTHNAHGMKIPLARLNEGDYFGEQALLGQSNKTRNANIETITDCTLIKVPENLFISMLQSDPAMTLRLKKIGNEQALHLLNLSNDLYENIKSIIAAMDDQTISEYSDGKIIFSEGDNSDKVYLILQGNVEVLFSGKTITSSLLHRGHFFGELGVIQNKPRSATAIARGYVKLLVISSEYFKNYMLQHPDVKKLFSTLHQIYQLPNHSNVEQYIGNIPKFGAAITSIYKMADGRMITASSILKQDIFTMSINNADYDTSYHHINGTRKIELHVKEGCIVNIKALGWWDPIPIFCKLLLDGTNIPLEQFQDFEKTGQLFFQTKKTDKDSIKLICECMSVNRQRIQDLINQGTCNFEEISSKTGACTVCRCCKYRILEMLGTDPWLSAKMKCKISHNDYIRSYIIKPTNLGYPTWLAGQHVVVQVAIEGNWVERSYTISNLSSQDNIRVTIKAEPKGYFTQWLFSKSPDELNVKITKPQGKFTITQDNNTAVLCFAGGIGITPFIAFAKSLAESDLLKQLHIFYCASFSSDFVFQDEFSEITQKNSNISVSYWATKELGRPTPDKIMEIVKQFNGPDIYICGSEGFVQMICSTLKQAQYKPDKIYLEKFVHAGSA